MRDENKKKRPNLDRKHHLGCSRRDGPCAPALPRGRLYVARVNFDGRIAEAILSGPRARKLMGRNWRPVIDS
jgi:hypothetical protein